MTTLAVVPGGLSVCLPAYNEEANLAAMVADVVDTMGARFSAVEVIVVNDGSTDRTAEVLRELERQYTCLRTVHHRRNLGYGAAVHAALSAATQDLLLPPSGHAVQHAKVVPVGSGIEHPVGAPVDVDPQPPAGAQVDASRRHRIRSSRRGWSTTSCSPPTTTGSSSRPGALGPRLQAPLRFPVLAREAGVQALHPHGGDRRPRELRRVTDAGRGRGAQHARGPEDDPARARRQLDAARALDECHKRIAEIDTRHAK